MTSETPRSSSSVGLRSEDLDPEARDALRALLEADPDAREEHRFAEALASALNEDDATGPLQSNGSNGAPTAADILAMAADRTEASPDLQGNPATTDGSRNWGGWAIAAAILVGIGAVAMGLWSDASPTIEPDLRPRGDALPDPEVLLEAVADGPDVRSLGHGAVVHDAEAVVFHVTTTRPGHLTLSEHGPGGARPILEWTGEAGRHPLSADDGTPLAWTPESIGVRRYVVQWCPEEGAVPCETDALELRWEGPR